MEFSVSVAVGAGADDRHDGDDEDGQSRRMTAMPAFQLTTGSMISGDRATAGAAGAFIHYVMMGTLVFGPYAVVVPPQRTKHLRFNELSDPEPIPPGTHYASVIESDVPHRGPTHEVRLEAVRQRPHFDDRLLGKMNQRPLRDRRSSA